MRGAEFFVVMEGDHDVGAAPRVQNSLRSGLPLNAPASPEQRCKHTSRPGRRKAAGGRMVWLTPSTPLAFARTACVPWWSPRRATK